MESPRGANWIGRAMAATMMGVAAAGVVLVLARQTVPPPDALVAPQVSLVAEEFDWTSMQRVHERFVDDRGLVDYAGLKADPSDLDAFLAQVRRISPHTNLATFPSREAALAYWIDAYNAWMLRAVIDAYPISSVNDIGEADGVFSVEGRICGGEDLSLNQIENAIVRSEFLEPRAHFALNCASMGCPWLPAEAFVPERLEEQLDREARRFFEDPAHLRIDPAGSAAYVSPILSWYSEDFVDWLREERGVERPAVLDYVRLYLGGDRSLPETAALEWQRYDWRLNDQAASWASREASGPQSAG